MGMRRMKNITGRTTVISADFDWRPMKSVDRSCPLSTGKKDSAMISCKRDLAHKHTNKHTIRSKEVPALFGSNWMDTLSFSHAGSVDQSKMSLVSPLIVYCHFSRPPLKFSSFTASHTKISQHAEATNVRQQPRSGYRFIGEIRRQVRRKLLRPRQPDWFFYFK